MKTLYQTKFLKTIALMAFLSIALPSQLLSAQDIPIYDPPPPTDNTIRNSPPTIRRILRSPIPAPLPTEAKTQGSKCSAVAPNVLSPDLDKRILTTIAYPTFLFFVPTTSARQVEFALKDSKKQPIYRRIFTLSKQSGIVRVVLPTGSISKLDVGHSYHWEFNLICDPDVRKHDDSVVGELQRVAPSDESKSAVSQVSLWERYRSIEYDGLVVLDAMRRANPTDRRLQTEWESWLERHKLGGLKQLPAIELK
ncbi:DUF928 domain-containing protein [Tumidithrix helvetica PCC 7403]|uniref:DUF928 domain-containing protein n=1 Tax=Tumidithrix helvetica TaxID=3457545 RepID=UPI003CAD3EB3